jgi:hypothetical protein
MSGLPAEPTPILLFGYRNKNPGECLDLPGRTQHLGLHRGVERPPGFAQLRSKRCAELALEAPHQRLAQCGILRWLNPSRASTIAVALISARTHVLSTDDATARSAAGEFWRRSDLSIRSSTGRHSASGSMPSDGVWLYSTDTSMLPGSDVASVRQAATSPLTPLAYSATTSPNALR